MKVLMSGLCLVVCLLGVWPAVAAPVISIQSQDTVVRLGDYFTIDVVITDVVDLYSIDLDVLFDTALMEYVSYTPGDFLASNGGSTFSPYAPSVNQACGTLEQYVETILGAPEGVDGGGILFSITFRAAEMGTGLIDIAGELSDSFALPIEYSREPGSVSVIPEPASMTMLGSLGAGLLFMHRRRRNKK